MSLSARTMKVTYTAAGSTTFAMPDVPIIDDSVEVVVYLRDQSVSPASVTLQTEGALNEYTLTGAPDANSFHTTVTFNTAPANGLKVIIALILPLTQVLNYNGNNSAGVRPTQLEEAFDRAIGMIQQHEEELSRVPKLGITEQLTTTQTVLPDPVPSTEGIWAWGTDGAARLYTLTELALAASGVPVTYSDWVEHAVTDAQSATDLTGETLDFAVNSSALYQVEIIRGTTVCAVGHLSIQNLNGTGRVLTGSLITDEAHGVTFSLGQVGTVATLKAALDTGAGNGTIKLSRRVIPV